MPETLSMKEVQALISEVRSHPRINNKPVLGVNVLKAQQAKNNGFPLHMYHAHLDSIIALSAEEQEALEKIGYVQHYIRKDYPKYKFRRNMDPKFKSAGFIEERLVPNPQKEEALLKERAHANCSKWVDRVAELEELPEAPTENPDVTIARLQGQLAEAREKAKKG